MRFAGTGLLLLLALACTPADPAPDASAPTSSAPVPPAALVDAVAKLPGVIGKYSGDDPVGTNPAYAVYERLAEAIDGSQAIALLAHESPIVRGYMIWHVGRVFGSDAPRILYRMLADDTGIEVRGYGCGGSIESIGTLALSEIIDVSSSGGVRDTLLREIARDERLTIRTRRTAVEKLTEFGAPDAKELALAIPQAGPDAMKLEADRLIREAFGHQHHANGY